MQRALTLLVPIVTACGTYSTLRPAPVAPPGHVEVGVGLAANQIGEVLPVVDGRVGLARRIEIGGHYEVYSGFVEGRVQALEEAAAGVSLSVGLGAGFATTFLDELGEEADDAQSPDTALFASLAASKRFGAVEPYLAARFALLLGKGTVTAPVAGLVFHLSRVLDLAVEGGAAIHVREGASVGIGQGAIGIGLHFQ